MTPSDPPPVESGEGSTTDRALEALQRVQANLARARAELGEQAADLETLDHLLAATLAEGQSILRSATWWLGDLLVHRIAKRLLGRREAAARWAPQTLREIDDALGHWRGELGPRTVENTAEGAAPHGHSETEEILERFERTIALERELCAIERRLEKQASEIERIHGWIRTAIEACGHLLASTRWRVGVSLMVRPLLTVTRLAGRSLTTHEERVAALREQLDDWERGRGARYSRYAASRSPAPLAPAAPRPRLARRSSRIAYGFESDPEQTVSIVVLNLDGATQLHNLLTSFLEWNSYPWVELLVVDHASRDDSAEVLESFSNELPLRLLPSAENLSFSTSNNRAAREAQGRYLLFLNNDVVFEEDLLPGLVARLRDPELGAVGPQLRYPDYHERSPDEVQHAGIRFRPDAAHCFYRPFNLARRLDPVGELALSPAITAAALLCRRQEFLDLGGFDEEFVYGYEDVDLSFKFRAAGLAVACDLDARLVHDESLTQRAQAADELRNRRLGNIRVLTRRYGYAVKRSYWRDLLAGERVWAERPARIGFAVKQSGPAATAGDFFTAQELGKALERATGASIRFLAQEGLADDWYDARGLDLLIVMLDGYDLGRLRGVSPGLLKVAWMRNWFERWAEQPWFGEYDLYLCSSQRAADAIRERTRRPADVLRIATDPERFHPGQPIPELASDYCFSGSYWGTRREIERCLDPSRIDGRFALFGEGWSGHPTFGAHSRGFLPYEQLPDAYRSTRIVIDDANLATRPWGSVNSRVFDALASGALVVTNGELGAREVFSSGLPIYSSRDDLEAILARYLEDEEARRQRCKALRSEVLARHTYRHRAKELLLLVDDFLEHRFRIAIKVPAPSAARAWEWGDYHMALALQRELESDGHKVRIDLLAEWETPAAVADDVVLVLRGLSRYEPKPLHINLMWNISHPDRVSEEEYEAYDHVFVASASFADELRGRLDVPVSELLQCTDPGIFHPDGGSAETERPVLFVGNSRRQRRPIVIDAIESGLPLTVFGALWEGLIPAGFVEGEHIPNEELRAFYSAAEVVLNDHWPAMREHGFISNRIFDAGACGACIVSDAAQGLAELFGDLVATYDGTPADLRTVVEQLRTDPQRRRRMGEELSQIVRREHTFTKRTRQILAVARAIHQQRLSALGPARQAASKPQGAGSFPRARETP